MFWSTVVSFAALAAIGFATSTTRDGDHYADHPPPYEAVTFAPSIVADPDQITITASLQAFLTSPTNSTRLSQTGTNTTAGTFDISGVLCTPKEGDTHSGSVQLLLHGIGFDSSYWDFAYQPENYSYVQAAAAAGWTTFRYDRLGTGQSHHPSDGFRLVQASTDLAILMQFITLLRSGSINSTVFSNIVGVGHSYGSTQLTALSGLNPSAVDTLILTGFSDSLASRALFVAGALYTRAADVNPAAFSSLPGSYVMTGLPQGNQFQFFYYPFFDPGAFVQARATEQPAALGVFSTLGTISGGSSNFTGPVHLVTGERDLAFCGGECDVVPVGMNRTILQLTNDMVFPKSRNASVYSPPNTGHGVNLHLSAPETYKEIMGWLESIY